MTATTTRPPSTRVRRWELLTAGLVVALVIAVVVGVVVRRDRWAVPEGTRDDVSLATTVHQHPDGLRVEVRVTVEEGAEVLDLGRWEEGVAEAVPGGVVLHVGLAGEVYVMDPSEVDPTVWVPPGQTATADVVVDGGGSEEAGLAPIDRDALRAPDRVGVCVWASDLGDHGDDPGAPVACTESELT